MKKGKIIAGLCVVISIVVIVILASVNNRPYLQVADLANNPDKYDEREIQVIGFVDDYDGDTFKLNQTDIGEIIVDVSNIQVPTEFETGIEVVVVGTFTSPNTLVAKEIITQCSQ